MKNHHLFPWWAGYLLLNPLRRLDLDPRELLGAHIEPGMTALDAGCAMGYFSVPMAEMAGPGGRVVCVDPQERMLSVLKRRAARRGLSGVIEARRCTFTSLMIGDLEGRVDTALAFGVLHEVNDRRAFVEEIAAALKPGGRLVFGEPHVVSEGEFRGELDMMQTAGLAPFEETRRGGNRIAVMRKGT